MKVEGHIDDSETWARVVPERSRGKVGSFLVGTSTTLQPPQNLSDGRTR